MVSSSNWVYLRFPTAQGMLARLILGHPGEHTTPDSAAQQPPARLPVLVIVLHAAGKGPAPQGQAQQAVGRLLVLVVLAEAGAEPSGEGQAQQPAAGLPVLVVFHQPRETSTPQPPSQDSLDPF